MRTLYFDCSMGAAGDMLTAALLELLPDPAGFVDRLNALGIPGAEFRAEPSTKRGIRGTHMTVTVHGVEEDDHLQHHHEADRDAPHPSAAPTPSPEGEGFGSAHELHHHHEHHHHDHHHTGLHGIEHLVRDHLALPEEVKADVLAVYGLLAEAESKVHGVPVEEIHFHEVGSLDAVADVTAVCLLMRELAPARVLASPVHVGCGQVRCAHGLMPVPAPATAELLRGVPIYGGAIQGELCTPPGAALLKYYVNSFGPMPLFRTEKIGYGMGKKDFPAANCVRAFWGESGETMGEDMTELFTSSIGMKKSRPGTMITVLCRPDQAEEMTALLLRHTTTLGVRAFSCRRTILSRRVETAETALGPVRKKISEGGGIRREKWEYEDLTRLARERGCSLEEILSML